MACADNTREPSENARCFADGCGGAPIVEDWDDDGTYWRCRDHVDWTQQDESIVYMVQHELRQGWVDVLNRSFALLEDAAQFVGKPGPGKRIVRRTILEEVME